MSYEVFSTNGIGWGDGFGYYPGKIVIRIDADILNASDEVLASEVKKAAKEFEGVDAVKTPPFIRAQVEQTKHLKVADIEALHIEEICKFALKSKYVKEYDIQTATWLLGLCAETRKLEAPVIAKRQLESQPKRLSLRKEVVRRDDSTCRYCGEKLEKGKIHLDHVIPYSLGGLTDMDNLVVACPTCNHKKSGRTPEQAGMALIPLADGNV